MSSHFLMSKGLSNSDILIVLLGSYLVYNVLKGSPIVPVITKNRTMGSFTILFSVSFVINKVTTIGFLYMGLWRS